MATLKIKLKGNDHSQFVKGEDQGFELYRLDKAFSVFAPTRGDVPEQNFEIQDNQLIELEFTDDTIWIGDREMLSILFPTQYKRSGEEDVLYFPDELESDAQERGIIKKVGIKLVKIFVKKNLIQPKMREMAHNLENKQLTFGGINFDDVKYGVLTQCSPQFELKIAGKLDSTRSHLLFLHGTGSSTEGSFADLAGTEEWSSLVNTYGVDQLLAFQHRSLTASPLENVLELVQTLPAGIELDLLSQSRGGLVADVLARFCASDQGFDPTERELFLKNDRKRDLEVISEIEAILRDKKIRIRKMIRVAGPANGTTLASNRLNIYLNVTFNLIGLALGQVGNPVFIAFKEMIMEAVSCKDDADVLPGLEAMNPKSPFIKALNFQATTIKIAAPLFVVGGSAELSLSFKSMVVLLGKFFFLAKNDLVVDTESMKWGGVREEGKVCIYIEKTGQINHFKYFKTEATRRAIFSGFEAAPGVIPSQFEAKLSTVERGVLGIEGGAYKRNVVSGDRPIAIMLPGIMGSNLSAGDNRIWINYLGFLCGDLQKLSYLGAQDTLLEPDSLIGTSYRSLGKNLEKTYDVVTFEFDWRKPLKFSAALLNDKVKELMKYDQPIKIIGHSMGGVLVRDFILYHNETWKSLNQLAGFRVLFLGSPLGGSYRIPYVLFGKDSIIQLLGKIDIRHSVKELIGIFCNFPGILNLLPINKSGRHDFANRNFWEKLRTAYGDESWPIPSQEVLDEFATHQKVVIENSDQIDYSKIVYIAGQSDKKNFTVSNLDIKEGELVFYCTNAGDESVTWESGIPAGIRALNQFYYANVTHGGLSNERKIFAAIDDLLIYGSTSKLQNSLPKLRGEEKDFEAKQTEEFDISEDHVVNSILGLSEEDEKWQEEIPVQLVVTHGDLKYAQYPVLAGHFEHDAILSTERAIDRQLNGDLSRLHSLGLYPGAIGSNQVVLAEDCNQSFKGSVIVGLGVSGELSGFLLMTSIEKGVSRYLTILNRPCVSDNSEGQDDPIGLSVIAIANSYGGLSTDSSVRAIVLGVQRANRNIRSIYGSKIKVIEEVEIIELYHDKALSILMAVQRLEASESKEFNVVFRDRGLHSTIGRRWRMPYDNSSDWWTRISVTEQSVNEDFPEGEKEIRMSISTTGASEKVEIVPSNDMNLEILLEEMTMKNQYSPEIAKTMYELLIPFSFKEELKRQNNISWILDLSSAEYPWEMMQEDLESVPLCIHSGMIRQLATMNFRERIAKVTERTALVVGDPFLNGFFPQLSGAKNEAELVASLLKTFNYQTESLINSTAPNVLVKLVSKNHKIIHLAGHGVFQFGPRKATGMIIGNNSFLTASQIGGMSCTAELVFVNCCYLGKMDSNAEVTSQQRNKFAANIGTQLINNGVRAVIVAGWAVDDAAALEFANQFYLNMLNGVNFGEAVKRARKRIFEEYGKRSNTWGAFQCYGDPFYKLTEEFGSAKSKSGFLITEELEIELQNLLQTLEANDYEPKQLKERLQEIETMIGKTATSNDAIKEYTASIYAGLGDYHSACACFDELLSSESSRYSTRVLEQNCNLRIKMYVQDFKAGKISLEEILPKIDNVIGQIRALLLFGDTAERKSLLGSAYKRKMYLLNGTKKKEMLSSLEEAVSSYQSASEKNGMSDPYQLTNWITLLQLKLIVEGITGISDIPLKARKALDELITKNDQSDSKSLSYWNLSHAASMTLTKHLLGLPKNSKDDVLQKYRSLWKMAGHQGNKNAEIEHFDVLMAILSIAKDKRAKDFIQTLTELKELEES